MAAFKGARVKLQLKLIWQRAVATSRYRALLCECHAPWRTVLQIPEWSTWNRFVESAGAHLASLGYYPLRPGLCLDDPRAAGAGTLRLDAVPDIVHLHWPDKLARQYGEDPALGFLRDLTRRGARVVQTVHNVLPHEGTEGQRRFLGEADALTVGAHFFSAEHERIARDQRPGLPARCLHLAHPRYPHFETQRQRGSAGFFTATLGCFGRLRSYKRVAEFTQAFIDYAGRDDRLIVAGFPDTATIDRGLRQISHSDARVDYRPGFHSDDDFARLFLDVGWVALPYRHVFSSGVLVNALQSGRRLLCPRPVGADAYNVTESEALIVEPWDDRVAIRRWSEAARRGERSAPVADCHLPTWEKAARVLTDFYDEVLSNPLPSVNDAVGGRRDRGI